MTAIARFTAWRPGFRKVSFTKLLMARGDLPFPIAKQTTDAFLEGTPVEVPAPSLEAAEVVLKEGELLGAAGEAVPGSAARRARGSQAA